MSNEQLLLQYLKSIEGTVKSIDKKVDGQDDRIRSLEQTRANQRGIMIGGGAVVTVFAGVVSWVVSIFKN